MCWLKILNFKIDLLGQDGGIGKHGLLFNTTTSKLQLKYRTTITQNYQKIELYGSLITKELKKSYSPRWVGGAKMQRHRDME